MDSIETKLRAELAQANADRASLREDMSLARLALSARDGETLPEAAARLWKLLAEEAASRGKWATETSRLIGVVERGARLRSEMVQGAALAMQERCAKVADDLAIEAEAAEKAATTERGLVVAIATSTASRAIAFNVRALK